MAKQTDIDYRAIVEAAWSEVLGNPSIDPTDNFFFLGGDSVCAVDAVNCVARQLDVTDQRDFVAIFMAMFDHPELGTFAEFLRTEQWAVSAAQTMSGPFLPAPGEG